ncbi:MAG: hypothetical protein WCL16_04910 [bacterium]
MQATGELRKRQKIIAGDFKARAQKAERILGAIEDCEKTLAVLNASLSAILGIGVKTVAVAVAGRTTSGKRAKKRSAKPALKGLVRDFMIKAGKPMKIAEVVQAMQKAGHVFQAKRPVEAMSLLMYNNKKVFKKVKPGTFEAV